MHILLLFPNQLVPEIPNNIDKVILIEHPIFYLNKARGRPKARFNRLRCTYTRATQDLWVQTHEKHWKIRWHQYNPRGNSWPPVSWLKGSSHMYMYDPVDSSLLQEARQWVPKEIPLEVMDSPLFLFTRDQLQEYCDHKDNECKRVLHHSSFYSWSRRELDVLMTKQGKVEGGKLSYDTDNRQSLSKSQLANVADSWDRGKAGGGRAESALQDAHAWTERHWKHHPGPASHDYKETRKRLQWFALTHSQAKQLLHYFIEHKVSHFGTYQDAIAPLSDPNSLFLYHSNLSHCINNGLLHVHQVVKSVQTWYQNNSNTNSALTQAEGFLRQVIGWREFGRLAAWKYRNFFWNSNCLQAKHRLSSKWYTGDTGVAPIDATICKAFDTGYLHHIERLMIIGNFMTLSGIHPKQMYQWFMEFAMDSYDWVMILNVFGMAAHADGGVSFTKPYVSSSNYVLKMSHYPKDPEWTQEWDDMYYSFLSKHKQRFESNPRMNLMMRGLKRRSSSS